MSRIEGISSLPEEETFRNILIGLYKRVNRNYIPETGNIVLEGRADELMHSEHVKRAYLGEQYQDSSPVSISLMI